MNRKGALVALSITVISFGNLQAQASSPAVPIEPVRAILNAFQSYQVVGLGTGAHNNEQGHAFVLSVIRHADFPAAGADLVVECGTARYQDVMDRFISGEEVRREVLRRAWEDTTQPHAGCETPIHEELYRAVRTVNTALPKERRIRVLLGDPPIEWDSPTAKADRGTFMAMRDSYPAQTIRKEVLGKNSKSAVPNVVPRSTAKLGRGHAATSGWSRSRSTAYRCSHGGEGGKAFAHSRVRNGARCSWKTSLTLCSTSVRPPR